MEGANEARRGGEWRSSSASRRSCCFCSAALHNGRLGSTGGERLLCVPPVWALELNHQHIEW